MTRIKIQTSPFHYMLMCLKLLDEWQTIDPDRMPQSGIRSGSTQFAQACLSEYLDKCGRKQLCLLRKYFESIRNDTITVTQNMHLIDTV